MTVTPSLTLPDTGASAWVWPIDPARYDRRPELTDPERAALDRLGVNLRRVRSYDHTEPEWRTIEWLMRPLDDVRAALGCPNAAHERAIDDATGLVLQCCARRNRSFWGWSDEDWARLIGSGLAEFKRIWPSGMHNATRPYVIAFAYLGGLTNFSRLGRFDRCALARRVFGCVRAGRPCHPARG